MSRRLPFFEPRVAPGVAPGATSGAGTVETDLVIAKGTQPVASVADYPRGILPGSEIDTFFEGDEC